MDSAPAEPPPASAAAPAPSAPSDPPPPPATAPDAEAAVSSNTSAPSTQQQPQPSTSSSAPPQPGAPKNPQSASPFPSTPQLTNHSFQTPPPPSQLQSHVHSQPQAQTAAPPVAPSPPVPSVAQPQPVQPPQQRPPQPGRPLRPSQPSFSSPLSSLPSPSAPLPPGGMAIGVPAALHQQRPPQQSPVSFSSFGPSAPFGQMFNGLSRGPVGSPNPSASTGAQVRQTVQTIPSSGVIGAHSMTSMRPGGVPGSNQQRPGQLTLRSSSPSTPQPPSGQKFQSHVLIRSPSSSSVSALSGSSQNPQPLQQPWMSGPRRPTNPASLSTAPFRPQNKAQVLQQKPHPPQQQQSTPTLPQSQTSSPQQQQKPLSQQQQHQKQQQPSLQQQQQLPLQPQQQQQVTGPTQPLAKVQQSAQQQQSSRSASQKTVASAAILQQVATQPSSTSPTVDAGEPGNRILSKRSIHELVTQIDPSEKLDPEVEDILVEIAEDFVESITTFGCSLAKHRKSTTLEAKDILLHLERHWNMTIPGFGGDEIKCFKKPFTNDIHKERLSLIKKSMISAPDTGNAKHSTAGQTATSSKGHAPKGPLIGSPRIT